MCFPYLESSPPPKSRSRRRPVTFPSAGIIGAHGANNGQQGIIPGTRCGNYNGLDQYRHHGMAQYPWHAQHQGLTWPTFNRPLVGYGALATERQLYTPTQEMVYALPYERNSLPRTSSGDRFVQHPRDAQVVFRDDGRGTYRFNKEQPVTVVIESRERGRPRSRGRTRRPRNRRQTSPFYPHRRRDSSSVDVYLHRSKSLPSRRRYSY